ncbi:hypothetical protein Tco_1222834 [Tanacetum coccineum]
MTKAATSQQQPVTNKMQYKVQRAQLALILEKQQKGPAESCIHHQQLVEKSERAFQFYDHQTENEDSHSERQDEINFQNLRRISGGKLKTEVIG